MVTIVDRYDQQKSTGRSQSAAHGIELLAHHTVTQWPIAVEIRGTTAKEGAGTQLTADAAYVVGVHGAGHQIPFRTIATLRPVGEAAAPLDPLETQHVYRFAGQMARETPLGLETVADRIGRAMVRQLNLAGVVVADTFDHLVASIPIADIVHVTPAGAA